MKQEEIDLIDRLKVVGKKLAEEFNVPWRGLDNIFYQISTPKILTSSNISFEFYKYFYKQYSLSLLIFLKTKRDNLEEIVEFSRKTALISSSFWNALIDNQILSEDFIIKYFDEIVRYCVEYNLYSCQKLSIPLIEKAFENGSSVQHLIRYQRIPEEILDKYFDRIKVEDGLGIIIASQDISEEFVSKHADDYIRTGYFGNVYLSPYLNWSKEFYDKFADNVQQIKILFPDGHEECRLSMKMKRTLDSKIYSYDRYKHFNIIELSEDNSLIVVE